MPLRARLKAAWLCLLGVPVVTYARYAGRDDRGTPRFELPDGTQVFVPGSTSADDLRDPRGAG